MNIVLATPLYPPETEPLASYVKELSLRLGKQQRVSIVAYASTSERIPTATLITVSKRRPLPLRLIKFTTTLWKAARGGDIIYAQSAVAAGLPALIVAKLRNIPLVVNFEGDEAWIGATQSGQTDKYLEDFLSSPEGGLRTKLLISLQGFVIRHADMVLTQSKTLAEIVSKYYRVPETRMALSYHVARSPEILPFTPKKVPFQVVSMCKLVKENGVDGIIRAVARLKEKFPEILLLIAGYGPEEAHLKSLVKKLSVENNVQFLGRVSHAEAWYICKNSSVYVHNPSKEFSLDHVLFGFAAGIPVVTTRSVHITQAVTDNESGLLTTEGDPQKIAQAIERIFTDSELAAHLTKSASGVLNEKFSWEAHIDTLMRIFTQIVKK